MSEMTHPKARLGKLAPFLEGAVELPADPEQREKGDQY